jgi:predicted ABC-type transport system involved in lysophospholipase L1 biosynthesis ATPase subunit
VRGANHYAARAETLLRELGMENRLQHDPNELSAGERDQEIFVHGLRHEGAVWSARQIEGKLPGQNTSTLFLVERGSVKANLKAADFSAESLLKF